MPAPETTRLQLNFKTPNGTLINLYIPEGGVVGDDLEALEGLAPQIAALEGVLGATSNAAGISAPPSAQNAASPPPWAPKGPSSGGGSQSAAPTCNHGAMVWREGISKKTNRPYKMWACASGDRNDQCDPQWVRD